MKQTLFGSVMVVVLLAAWGGSLYVAQDWGYKRARDSKEVLLCQDALQRRLETERALLQPTSGFSPGTEFPLEALTGMEELGTVVDRLRIQLATIERDIARFCGEASSGR